MAQNDDLKNETANEYNRLLPAVLFSIMHVKSKYIQAVEDAIDFMQHNVDGADDEQGETETIKILRELANKMNESQHKQRVRYYVRKNGR
jgi:hypothetical protein